MAYRAWCDELRAFLHNEGLTRATLDEVTMIGFKCYIKFPDSYSKKKRAELAGQPHMEKPDIDNILKGLMDALLKDDKKVWKLLGSPEKRWEDKAGVRIELELMKH
jgi:Holliday junction resolvase RusA-like endonuclease